MISINWKNITEEKTIEFAHFETKFNQTGQPFILAKLWEDLSNLKYLVTGCCKRWFSEDKSLTNPEIFFTCSAIQDFNYFVRQNTIPPCCLLACRFVHWFSLVLCGGISCFPRGSPLSFVCFLLFVCLFVYYLFVGLLFDIVLVFSSSPLLCGGGGVEG